MAVQSQPSRIPQPFAGSGTKNTIPATNATPSASQAASWASGFPPECSQPISAGGCPVPRNDVNGALNQLSQDFAFRQDGGIWEWSALADYDIQRMVRGSDGLLYWSVAQSGPGFGAGAVDPTTDDGTYWSSPALKTMPLADKSAMGATTEWVKDLAAAPVYLDPAGDDANDGMSAASAVQTFAKAIEIGSALPQNGFKLIVAGGSYTGGISLLKQQCLIDLLGDVTLNGDVDIEENSYIMLYGGYTLSIQGNINLNTMCNLLSKSNISITSVSSYAVRIAGGSCMVCQGDIEITSTGATDVVLVFGLSYFAIRYNLNISGSSNTNAIVVTDGSAFFTDNTSSFSVASGAVSIGCVLNRMASAYLLGESNVYAGNIGIQVDGASVMACRNNLAITLTTANSATGVGVYFNSAFSMDHSTSYTLTINSGGNTENAVACLDHSVAMLNSNLKISGLFHGHVISCINVSYTYIPSDVTVTNNATGARYYVGGNSGIGVSGAGTGRIPGNANGYVDATSFYG